MWVFLTCQIDPLPPPYHSAALRVRVPHFHKPKMGEGAISGRKNAYFQPNQCFSSPKFPGLGNLGDALRMFLAKAGRGSKHDKKPSMPCNVRLCQPHSYAFTAQILLLRFAGSPLPYGVQNLPILALARQRQETLNPPCKKTAPISDCEMGANGWPNLTDKTQSVE